MVLVSEVITARSKFHTDATMTGEKIAGKGAGLRNTLNFKH